MNDVELSVQELSNRTGRSIQSIYKRIRNKNDVIQGFLKRDSEGNVLEPVKVFESVIDVVYNKGNSKPKPNTQPSLVEFRQKEEGKERKEEQTAYSKTIEVLQEQLNLLQEELKAERADKEQKDKLIFELNERLAESQRNLDQQQQLQLLDRRRIQELEERNTRPLHQRLLDVFRKKGAEEQ